jgi:hypothetical protein
MVGCSGVFDGKTSERTVMTPRDNHPDTARVEGDGPRRGTDGSVRRGRREPTPPAPSDRESQAGRRPIPPARPARESPVRPGPYPAVIDRSRPDRGDVVNWSIAIYGGSFNPPGRHHRAIVEQLCRHFDAVPARAAALRGDRRPAQPRIPRRGPGAGGPRPRRSRADRGGRRRRHHAAGDPRALAPAHPLLRHQHRPPRIPAQRLEAALSVRAGPDALSPAALVGRGRVAGRAAVRVAGVQRRLGRAGDRTDRLAAPADRRTGTDREARRRRRPDRDGIRLDVLHPLRWAPRRCR